MHWLARIDARTRKVAALVLALAVGAAALAVSLRGVGVADMLAALARQPAGRIAEALALTATSFACLALYDVVSVHVVARGRVRWRVAALAGACGAAIANTLGLHAVSGTAVRAHLYLPAGLAAAELARVASLSWLSLVAGNLAMLAIAEVAAGVHAPSGQGGMLHLAVGLAMLLAMACWLAWLAGGLGGVDDASGVDGAGAGDGRSADGYRATRVIAIGRFRFPMPSAALAAGLMAIGAIESGTAIGALYLLLPADLTPPFAVFAIGCIAAVTLGVIAHTPGGIGVFEASMTMVLAARGRSDLLAALLLYRFVYNLLPFLLAVGALGWRAWRQRGSSRRSPST